jgi:hypothetical protein
MSKVINDYYWSLNKQPNKTYEVDVWLYDTQKEMLEDYKGSDKTFHKYINKVEGIFVPTSMNNRYIGSIRLCKDKLSIENIVHECFHAGIETLRHMGRHLSKRYEEKIVTASAQLASTILKDYKKYLEV